MKKVIFVAAIPSLLIFACSSKTEKDSPPSDGQYDVAFPSTASAVVAESIQLLVFDASQPDTDCQTLVNKRKSKQELPPRIFESPLITPCEMLKTTQEDGGKAVLPKIAYGPRSILAVALYAGGKDFMIGCGRGDLAQGSPALRIDMANANAAVPAPTTNCQTLSQKCSQSPPCQ